MAVRKIIRIDEEKCDGCGQCVPACAEGAIQVIDGKARLVSETYCDGLGACLGECPQDAIRIEERQAEEFDPAAVAIHLAGLSAKEKKPQSAIREFVAHQEHSGCPGATSREISREPVAASDPGTDARPAAVSRLSNWPVQLHLAPVQAPFFNGADILIAADCAPFAFADFHEKFIAGKKLLIGCPKLDDSSAYVDKLTQILALNDIRSIEIAFMEVPCCFGLVSLVKQALDNCGSDIPLKLAKIGIRGELQQRHEARSERRFVVA